MSRRGYGGRHRRAMMIDERLDLQPPDFKRVASAKEDDKGLKTIVLHVDGQAETSVERACLLDLLHVLDEYSAFEAQLVGASTRALLLVVDNAEKCLLKEVYLRAVRSSQREAQDECQPRKVRTTNSRTFLSFLTFSESYMRRLPKLAGWCPFQSAILSCRSAKTCPNGP